MDYAKMDQQPPPQQSGYGYDQPPAGNPPMQQQPQYGMGPLSQTTVIVQPQQVQVNMPKYFSTGVCGCCDDLEICCIGTWVPCILGCQVASAMNESCCVPNCLMMGLYGMRSKARMQYNIGVSYYSISL